MTETDQEATTPRDGIGGPELPTIFVESVSVTYWRGHVKIVFREHIEKKRFARAAILMEEDDVDRLVKHLKRVLDKMAAEESEDSSAPKSVPPSVKSET